MEERLATHEEFLKSLQLIWDNCKLYNQKGSEIYKLCDRLEKFTQKEFFKYRASLGLHDLEIPEQFNKAKFLKGKPDKPQNEKRAQEE